MRISDWSSDVCSSDLKANLPVRVNPGVLANEAYGVKTTAKDLIHYVKLSIDSSQGEGALDKILRDTRVGYFKLGAMTQDLNWEQYDEPVQLNDLPDGTSAKVAYDTDHTNDTDPPPDPPTQAPAP